MNKSLALTVRAHSALKYNSSGKQALHTSRIEAAAYLGMSYYVYTSSVKFPSRHLLVYVSKIYFVLKRMILVFICVNKLAKVVSVGHWWRR